MLKLRVVRIIGGFLAILVLLGLIVADFWFQGRHLSNEMMTLLVTLIGSLLGIDMIIERLPVEITVEQQGDSEQE